MKKFLLISILLLNVLSLFAQNGDVFSMDAVIKNPPSPPRLVNDYANILTEDQRQSLESKLVQLDDSSFTQIVVVIVPNLGGADVADAAIELGRSWGVGNKKNNSGVVLLISKDDRKLNISPGYGLEGALTDVESSDIIDRIIVPKFKGNDYYRGINEGTDAIISAVKGTYNTARPKSRGGKAIGGIMPVIIIIVLVILFSSRGGGGGSFMSRRGFRGMPGAFIWPIGGGGGFGGGGSSSGGGGFGGFGGGSFGGGGSSGSW